MAAGDRQQQLQRGWRWMAAQIFRERLDLRGTGIMIAQIAADHLDRQGAIRARRQSEDPAVGMGIVWINRDPGRAQFGEDLFVGVGAEIFAVRPALGIVLVLLVALLGMGLGISVGFLVGTVCRIITQETAEDVTTRASALSGVS